MGSTVCVALHYDLVSLSWDASYESGYELDSPRELLAETFIFYLRNSRRLLSDSKATCLQADESY